MITRQEARQLVETFMDAKVRNDAEEEIVIEEEATIQTSGSWVFFYNTRRFLETRSVSHALAGNGPIVVNTFDGRVRMLESNRPWEEQVE